MGLVDELQPDELLLDRSLEAAAALAALPRTAYSQVKRQLREAYAGPHRAGAGRRGGPGRCVMVERRDGRRRGRAARPLGGRRRSGELLLHRLGRDPCLFIPVLLGLEAECRPTTCGRCRTGMPRSSRSTNFSASGCCRSRLRWQSGQGVTRQSAPASIASARWRPAWRSEGGAVHRDHREAAALAGAGVVDRLGANGLDQHVEVGVPLGVVGKAEPARRPDDVAAVERRDPQALGDGPRAP